MPRSFDICQEVSLLCPVEATVLGYYPNFGANVFFCILFGICAIVSFVTGIWKRTWTYTFAITSGCTLEVLGYIGRILLHKNPWNQSGFKLQICCLILAPTLLSAGIYLTLKHVALGVGPEISRVKPKWYTWIFIPCDIFCLVLQGIGGGVAASAETDLKMQEHGNRLILSGIVLQVVVLGFFGISALDYFRRAYRYHRQTDENSPERRTWMDRNFRIFCGAVSGAYLGIFFRCIYRIAEMAGGWKNRIMQDEPSFIVMEGVMILIPAILLAGFPPGFLFPQMCTGFRSRTPKEG